MPWINQYELNHLRADFRYAKAELKDCQNRLERTIDAAVRDTRRLSHEIEKVREDQTLRITAMTFAVRLFGPDDLVTRAEEILSFLKGESTEFVAEPNLDVSEL